MKSFRGQLMKSQQIAMYTKLMGDGDGDGFGVDSGFSLRLYRGLCFVFPRNLQVKDGSKLNRKVM